MANSLYDEGREAFLDGNADWDTNDTRVVCVDEADDTIDLAVDDNLDDRAVASRVATSGAMAGKTAEDGIADAGDLTITSVSGDQFESLDIYKHTGVESTSRLLCNIDTATGLPFTPSGGNVTIVWDDTASVRIFKL